MRDAELTVALITEVFVDDPDGRRLTRRLTEARERGAELAVLPELPLDPWVPAHREPDPDDAEPPGGPRASRQADAARRAGLALLGGAIVRDPATGRRHNTALLFDRRGRVLDGYRKVHLPDEPGFREAAHYEPGSQPPRLVDAFAMPLGIQICSDANRTTGCQLLAAAGAAVILVPRATPAETWARWRLVLRADAVTSAAWLVTVNRPADPAGPIGGPSAVIAPDGRVVAESEDGLAIVRLDGRSVTRARTDYPGYLDFHPALYRDAWDELVPSSDGD